MMKKDEALLKIYRDLNSPKAKHFLKTFLKYLILFAVVVAFYIYATYYIYEKFEIGTQSDKVVYVDVDLPEPANPVNQTGPGPAVKTRGLRIQQD